MTESAATGDDYFTENPHADVAAEAADDAAGTDSPNTVEGIAEEVRDEIRLGHVEDDVSHVLEERWTVPASACGLKTWKTSPKISNGTCPARNRHERPA
jgi:hypothetical protein